MQYPIYLTHELEYYEMPEGAWEVFPLSRDYAYAKNGEAIWRIARGKDGALHAEQISQLELTVDKSRVSRNPADSVYL
mgnify:CR=1 FL=1